MKTLFFFHFFSLPLQKNWKEAYEENGVFFVVDALANDHQRGYCTSQQATAPRDTTAHRSGLPLLQHPPNRQIFCHRQKGKEGYRDRRLRRDIL
jgi:hypothetical protein